MKLTFRIFTFLVITSFSVYGQLPYDYYGRQWKPQKDDIYLQEVSEKIATDSPVVSVAEIDGVCFALMENRINRLENGELKPVQSAPAGVRKLMRENGLLWALTDGGLYRYGNNTWQKFDDRNFVDLCTHGGKLYAATRDEIFRLEGNSFVSTKPEGGYYSNDITMIMEDGTQLHANPVRLGPINRIESYSGTLYVLRPGKLVSFDGLTVDEDFVDFGTWPSANLGDILRHGNRLLVSTDRGLAVLRGAALSTIQGRDGLPVENTTCLAAGFDGDVWIGTKRGAVRMLENDWHYFGGQMWLPDNNVNSIAVGKDVVYIATDGGLGIIKYEPYTLLKKAEHFERHMDEWGHKRMGFIHTLYKKDGKWIREISDNDGEHTSAYLAAMSYKYAVTGDRKAREEAVESFKAMAWLEQISPVRGLFARAIWSTTHDEDRMSTGGSGGLPAKWYPTPDGKWYWKGDTSSDEVIAHFYAVSLFHDIAAEGKEKDLARQHLERIAGYIIDCGWVLIDLDGEPTRWGRWNPEYLLRQYGYSDRGVNGLEALGFTKTALALTGDKKFEKGYQQLVDWRYPENTIRQKNVFPPGDIATWDDDLAYKAYYILFRYNSDNDRLQSIYMRSLERTFEIKRMEHIPWFNYIYGLVTGNECEVEQSAEHLRAWVLDCVQYSYSNSHRDDLFPEAGYTSYEAGKKRISPREMAVKRGSRSAIALDGRSNGNVVMEPTGYLRDYWMGRYYGFIEAPETTDPALISVKRDRQENVGAEPYNGPGRPEIKLSK